MNFDQFLMWEATSNDTIDFKKIYVDVAEDLNAGLILSEIVYWYLPSKNGGTKLRVMKGGKYWIAVRRYEWWARTRMTPKQADSALRKLVDLGLIEKRVFRFNGEPTVHVCLLQARFLASFIAVLENPPENPFLPKAQNLNSPEGETLFPATDETDSLLSESPLTENTASTSSEITKQGSLVLPLAGENQDRHNKDALIELNAAIADVWKTKGLGKIAEIRKTLLGLHPSGSEHWESNIVPPATAIEVRKFADYFHRQYPDAKMPLTPYKLQDWFYQSRETKGGWVCRDTFVIELDEEIPVDINTPLSPEQILDYLKRYEPAEYLRVLEVLKRTDQMESPDVMTIVFPKFHHYGDCVRLPILMPFKARYEIGQHKLTWFDYLNQNHPEVHQQVLSWMAEIDKRIDASGSPT